MLDSINILILEDSKVDYMVTKRTLLKNAPNALLTHAKSREDFEQRISWMEYDLILADYHLPGYNGLEALLYARQHYAEIPFIFLSGTLSDESKVAQAILQGANGYETKENVSKLWGMIETVLADAKVKIEERRNKEAAERARKLMLQKAVGLLRQADSFSQKQEILAILEQVSSKETEQSTLIPGTSSAGK